MSKEIDGQYVPLLHKMLDSTAWLSMSSGARLLAGDPKWELIRRLRRGGLLRLFRDRWGYSLPDDDAGRGDLWALVCNSSLAERAPEQKMRADIEIWAPWMPPEERNRYVTHMWGLDIFERTETGRQIGSRLMLTNAIRKRLKLWQFKPIDATDEELEAERKTRQREREMARRRSRGVRPRNEYLAASRPWLSEGIPKSTHYYRRAKAKLDKSASNKTVSEAAADLSKSRLGLPPEEACREEKAGKPAEGPKRVERTASRSPDTRTHLSKEQREQKSIVFAILARELSGTDPQMAWGMMACSLSFSGADVDPRIAALERRKPKSAPSKKVRKEVVAGSPHVEADPVPPSSHYLDRSEIGSGSMGHDHIGNRIKRSML